MYGSGKSDRPIIPKKRPNKGTGKPEPAEAVEGRGLAKGKAPQQNVDRTQSRETAHSELERIRQAARRRKEERFTSLWHHVVDVNRLRESYYQQKRDSSPGVDGQTWKQYGEELEENLQDLTSRLRRGAYRAKPVKRGYVPKGETGRRPIGMPTLKDKIVQRSTVEVLNAIYETDFKAFSYGFRPGRSQHNALDALSVALERRKVSWVLDADIRGFFDNISQEWLIKFIEHRIADKRVVRQIQKWLKAGVLEDGKKIIAKKGTPQGGSISPLLANIYLHYALDLWVAQWRKQRADGDVIIVRYADDFAVGFQYHDDAKRFQQELKERLQKFNLELNEEKTRLIEFGRFASQNRNRRGQGKPETFDFLGFTHICGKSRNGRFAVKRYTARKKMRAKLKDVKRQLRKRLNLRVADVGRYLGSVLRGHYQYYGVPGNSRRMSSFRYWMGLLWYKSLRRRSQKDKTTWARTERLIKRWFPQPHIVHPYPSQRLSVTTQGKSPVH
jgi:group II intron reverse transcriptase/maturase